MLDYRMLAHKDRILVAISGGMDSLVLCWLLHHWRLKAPIEYSLQAVHVDMAHGKRGPGEIAGRIAAFCRKLGLDCDILPAAFQVPSAAAQEGSGDKDLCFHCARQRRNQLFDHAQKNNLTAIALGHHRDDIIETFLLNLLYGGNISTMKPRQDLFSGQLALIRPLAYLDKEEVATIGKRLEFEAMELGCPLSEQTKRKEMGALLRSMEDTIPDIRRKIFAALGNVRLDYLLLQNQRK